MTNANESSVRYYRPEEPGVATEFEGFLRLLPALREVYSGQYVAIRAEGVVASGLHLNDVLKSAKTATGDAPFYCGWIEPTEGYIFRSGKVVVLLEAEVA